MPEGCLGPRKADLWGEDLSVFLDGVYGERYHFCVVMASEEYVKREWPRRELQSAVARAIREKGDTYLLPVRVDPVSLPGVPPTIGYLDLANHIPEHIGALLVQKLEARGVRPPSR